MPATRNDTMPASQPILAAVSLASGVSLLITLTFNIDLVVPLALLLLTAASAVIYHYKRLAPHGKRVLLRQLRLGSLIGLVATAAYDAIRLTLVALVPMSVHPFDAFPLFGQLIIGENVSRTAMISAGAMYHILNGVSFSIGYMLLLAGRPWFFGIGWAMGLEAAMLTVYPGWLDLEGVMGEFVTISVLGHAAYGLVIGWLGQVLFARPVAMVRR